MLRPHHQAARRVLLLAPLAERLHGRDGGGERRRPVPDADEVLLPHLRVVDGEEVDGLRRAARMRAGRGLGRARGLPGW